MLTDSMIAERLRQSSHEFRVLEDQKSTRLNSSHG